MIFFAAWLSHVPMSRFEEFWRLLRGLLAAGGRLLFVDEHVEGRDKEAYLPGGDEIVGSASITSVGKPIGPQGTQPPRPGNGAND